MGGTGRCAGASWAAGRDCYAATGQLPRAAAVHHRDEQVRSVERHAQRWDDPMGVPEAGRNAGGAGAGRKREPRHAQDWTRADRRGGRGAGPGEAQGEAGKRSGAETTAAGASADGAVRFAGATTTSAARCRTCTSSGDSAEWRSTKAPGPDRQHHIDFHCYGESRHGETSRAERAEESRTRRSCRGAGPPRVSQECKSCRCSLQIREHHQSFSVVCDPRRQRHLLRQQGVDQDSPSQTSAGLPCCRCLSQRQSPPATRS